MFKPLTTNEFNQLLHMAADIHNIDPKKTYLEVTWDHIFKPVIQFSNDKKKNSYYLIVGDVPCNTFNAKYRNHVIPTSFYIWADVSYEENIVHKPMTLDEVMDYEYMLSFDTFEFLFLNSPINYYVNINPFKTCIYRNYANDTILSFYVDNRDSGEWRSFSDMEPHMINVIDCSQDEYHRDTVL